MNVNNAQGFFDSFVGGTVGKLVDVCKSVMAFSDVNKLNYPAV